MDATPVSPEETRRYFEQKDARRARALDARFAEATADASAIIAMIAEDFNPVRIWQWGSLLDRSRFSGISDIDIAVEGFPGDAAAWFRLLGKAEGLSRFDLDILQLEKIEPLHAASIRREGRIAYERP